jgi:hypothetical protein
LIVFCVIRGASIEVIRFVIADDLCALSSPSNWPMNDYKELQDFSGNFLAAACATRLSVSAASTA